MGVQRFEGIVQNLNATLMNEEYNMRVLADVQQARKLLAPFSQAESMPDLFEKVMLCCAATACTLSLVLG